MESSWPASWATTCVSTSSVGRPTKKRRPASPCTAKRRWRAMRFIKRSGKNAVISHDARRPPARRVARRAADRAGRRRGARPRARRKPSGLGSSQLDGPSTSRSPHPFFSTGRPCFSRGATRSKVFEGQFGSADYLEPGGRVRLAVGAARRRHAGLFREATPTRSGL